MDVKTDMAVWTLSYIYVTDCVLTAVVVNQLVEGEEEGEEQ